MNFTLIWDRMLTSAYILIYTWKVTFLSGLFWEFQKHLLPTPLPCPASGIWVLPWASQPPSVLDSKNLPCEVCTAIQHLVWSLHWAPPFLMVIPTHAARYHSFFWLSLCMLLGTTLSPGYLWASWWVPLSSCLHCNPVSALKPALGTTLSPGHPCACSHHIFPVLTDWNRQCFLVSVVLGYLTILKASQLGFPVSSFFKAAHAVLNFSGAG